MLSRNLKPRLTGLPQSPLSELSEKIQLTQEQEMWESNPLLTQVKKFALQNL